MLLSCQKDRLTGELDAFEGRYTWTHSRYRPSIWSTNFTTTPASNFDYTAEVEFTDQGKIVFYIDGEAIHKTRYKILEQEDVELEGVLSLRIDPAIEDTKEIKLNNFIDFTLVEDTLTIDDFPGASYDEQAEGTHYFVRN
jgi:hypothetical protein